MLDRSGRSDCALSCQASRDAGLVARRCQRCGASLDLLKPRCLLLTVVLDELLKFISQVALAQAVSAEGLKGVEKCAAPCAVCWAGVLRARGWRACPTTACAVPVSAAPLTYLRRHFS